MKRQYDTSKLEKYEICSKCTDICCKKCGCAYFPEDFKFELNFDNLKSEIDKGFIAIDMMIGTETPSLKLLDNPVYYLRVRNINDETPIGIGKRGCCKKLNGICDFPLDKRPSGGKYYIPFEGNSGCYTLYTDQEFVNFWLPYQELIMLLIEYYSKK